MKSPYVNELTPEQIVTATFLVLSKEVRQKKNGEPYLSLTLSDRSGEIDAKMWDNVAESVDTFERDDFVKVKGLAQIYHNRPQLTVHKVKKVEDSEVDFADFFPASRRDPAQMFAELRQILETMTNPHLKGLLFALLDDGEIARRFQIAPAAKQIHHAYLSGLLEHVLSLCHLCRLAAGHYQDVDLDLLLAGAVLHDIGKIYELSYQRGFNYTTEGQLIGHMVIGLRLVADKLRNLPGFPEQLRTLVEHIILSHHGQLEFGSPKLPQFPEAVLFHYLDDMDSKMECMRALIERERHSGGHFTTYNSPLERSLLRKERFLEDTVETAQSPRPVSALPPARPPAAKPGGLFGDKLLEALQPPKGREE
jgi:3'-5' exoribonuclease